MRRYIAVMIGVLAMSNPSMAQNDAKSTRHNGTKWLYFGPGVINSCKLIKVSLLLNDDVDDVVETLVSERHELAILKNWIRANFESKLNLSPASPQYKSVLSLNSITLYSSHKATEEDILVFIPLNHLTIAHNKGEYDHKLEELKKLCGRGINTDRKE